MVDLEILSYSILYYFGFVLFYHEVLNFSGQLKGLVRQLTGEKDVLKRLRNVGS